jgi:hypothetical protein
MDEVNLLIDILDTKWSTSATALESGGYITSSHTGKPNLIDVRSLEKNKGVRYDLSSKDVIIFFEDSQSIEYPTIHYDVRAGGDASFGRDRLRALYLIARHALESARRGYTASDGSNFNQIFVGSRSESNDRAKRLFGYKVNIEAKRFALTVP